MGDLGPGFLSKRPELPVLSSSCGNSTSTECLSDLSSSEESSRDGAYEYTPNIANANKIARRQSAFIKVTDVHSISSACSEGSHSTCRCDSAMEEVALSGKSCAMKEKLSITIPQSQYSIFPSDLPKEAITECIQSVFDSISLAFHSRFDKDKRAWAVYSTSSSTPTRFKIHIYEFDGITHVEMRAEAGCEGNGNVIFHMLQSAVGRISGDAEEFRPVDSYCDSISCCIPPEEQISDRDMRRNMKSYTRFIQKGSIVELESACVSLLQATLFEDMLPVLADCIPPLLDRLLADDVIGKLNQPIAEPPSQLSGLKSKGSLRSIRQKGYSVLPSSGWNAYVRATDVLRRLSASEEYQDSIIHNSCIVTYFYNFITVSLSVKKAFLMRRNIAAILSNVSSQNPYEILISGLTETVCLTWLSPVPGQCALKDPHFVIHVRNIMHNLGFSLP